MDPDSKQDNRQRIDWRHGLLFFLGALGVQFLIVFFIVLIKTIGFFGKTPEGISASLASPLLVTLQIAITSAGLAALALFIPRLFRVHAPSWLRLQKPNFALVVLSLLGMAAVGFLADEVVFQLHSLFPILFDPAGLAGLNTIFASADSGSFIALTVVVSLGPGIGEELFFRGFVLRSFLASWPPALAVIASSLLFGIMHIDPLQAAGAGLIGVFLAFVVLQTGSVWTGVAAHALNNLICALVARFDDGASSDVWNQGHSLPVLLIATTAACIACLGIIKISKQLPQSKKR